MTMKWNSRPGRRATGTPGTDKAVRHTKWIIAGGIAVVVSITAVFTLWWYGAFLPHWITWNEKEFFYEGGEVILKPDTPGGENGYGGSRRPSPIYEKRSIGAHMENSGGLAGAGCSGNGY